MSPEIMKLQVNKDTGYNPFLSDVYSLGLLFLSLYTLKKSI